MTALSGCSNSEKPTSKPETIDTGKVEKRVPVEKNLPPITSQSDSDNRNAPHAATVSTKAYKVPDFSNVPAVDMAPKNKTAAHPANIVLKEYIGPPFNQPATDNSGDKPASTGNN